MSSYRPPEPLVRTGTTHDENNTKHTKKKRVKRKPSYQPPPPLARNPSAATSIDGDGVGDDVEQPSLPQRSISPLKIRQSIKKGTDSKSSSGIPTNINAVDRTSISVVGRVTAPAKPAADDTDDCPVVPPPRGKVKSLTDTNGAVIKAINNNKDNNSGSSNNNEFKKSDNDREVPSSKNVDPPHYFMGDLDPLTRAPRISYARARSSRTNVTFGEENGNATTPATNTMDQKKKKVESKDNKESKKNETDKNKHNDNNDSKSNSSKNTSSSKSTTKKSNSKKDLARKQINNNGKKNMSQSVDDDIKSGNVKSNVSMSTEGMIAVKQMAMAQDRNAATNITREFLSNNKKSNISKADINDKKNNNDKKKLSVNDDIETGNAKYNVSMSTEDMIAIKQMAMAQDRNAATNITKEFLSNNKKGNINKADLNDKKINNDRKNVSYNVDDDIETGNIKFNGSTNTDDMVAYKQMAMVQDRNAAINITREILSNNKKNNNKSNIKEKNGGRIKKIKEEEIFEEKDEDDNMDSSMARRELALRLSFQQREKIPDEGNETDDGVLPMTGPMSRSNGVRTWAGAPTAPTVTTTKTTHMAQDRLTLFNRARTEAAQNTGTAGTTGRQSSVASGLSDSSVSTAQLAPPALQEQQHFRPPGAYRVNQNNINQMQSAADNQSVTTGTMDDQTIITTTNNTVMRQLGTSSNNALIQVEAYPVPLNDDNKSVNTEDIGSTATWTSYYRRLRVGGNRLSTTSGSGNSVSSRGASLPLYNNLSRMMSQLLLAEVALASRPSPSPPVVADEGTVLTGRPILERQDTWNHLLHSRKAQCLFAVWSFVLIAVVVGLTLGLVL